MKDTQVIIIGGGLAGLTAAIHLSLRNIGVILIEKEEYPHHKVCGEYLSREVLPYLELLGIDLTALNAPEITRLEYTSQDGKGLTSKLEMGGLGISRYTLDNYLYSRTQSLNCKTIRDMVIDVKFQEDHFLVDLSNGNQLKSDFVIGAYGKRSQLDKKLERPFIQESSGWLAVKSHYQNKDYPDDLVSLHNFNGGYCGLSKTETGTINVCYLATYRSFKQYKNTDDYREKVLMKNPELKEFFINSESMFDKDLSIAQVCFDKKSLIQDHILMTGDAAGLIHPLCGNGMAMAIHSAKIASEGLIHFFENKNTTRAYLEARYRSEWKNNFSSRMKTGRILQKILLNKNLSKIAQSMIRSIPGLMPVIIQKTHGKPVYAQY